MTTTVRKTARVMLHSLVLRAAVHGLLRWRHALPLLDATCADIGAEFR